MSIKLMSKVWELQLSHELQAVLLALADHAHDDGSQCYPGVEYLAWKTGYDRRSVQRILRRLEASELIIPVADSQGGRGQATEYLIDLSKGERKDPFEPRSRAAYQQKKGGILPPFTSEKGDKMPPFSGGQKGGIRDTKRAACETKRAASTTQKGGVGAAPTIRNHQEPSTEHTHPAARAAESTPVATEQPGSVSVSKSKFTLTERRAYAEAQQPQLGAGWLFTSGDGRFDELIELWQESRTPERLQETRAAQSDGRKTYGEAAQLVFSMVSAGQDPQSAVDSLPVAEDVRLLLVEKFVRGPTTAGSSAATEGSGAGAGQRLGSPIRASESSGGR